jgi:RimJ/RimL family protein N-acetyltransferase
VAATGLLELQALKADPRVFAVMLGGVGAPHRAAEELAEEIAFWGRHGISIWTVRRIEIGTFLGITCCMDQPAGLGIALRFSFVDRAHGHGYASEAAAAALRFAREHAGLSCVVGAARADSVASRQVLGSIGMRQRGALYRAGVPMLVFESTAVG